MAKFLTINEVSCYLDQLVEQTKEHIFCFQVK